MSLLLPQTCFMGGSKYVDLCRRSESGLWKWKRRITEPLGLKNTSSKCNTFMWPAGASVVFLRAPQLAMLTVICSHIAILHSVLTFFYFVIIYDSEKDEIKARQSQTVLCMAQSLQLQLILICLDLNMTVFHPEIFHFKSEFTALQSCASVRARAGWKWHQVSFPFYNLILPVFPRQNSTFTQFVFV